MDNFDPNNAENNQDVEHHWALQAMMHAETYFKMLKTIKDIKLTKHDDVLYENFRKAFPHLNVQKLVERDLKTDVEKDKWRKFIDENQNLVEDYNFGTLLRNDSSQSYSEENSFFVVRLVFVVIEIARNREGHNKIIYDNKDMIPNEEIDTKEIEKEMEELKGKIIKNLE